MFTHFIISNMLFHTVLLTVSDPVSQAPAPSQSVIHGYNDFGRYKYRASPANCTEVCRPVLPIGDACGNYSAVDIYPNGTRSVEPLNHTECADVICHTDFINHWTRCDACIRDMTVEGINGRARYYQEGCNQRGRNVDTPELAPPLGSNKDKSSASGRAVSNANIHAIISLSAAGLVIAATSLL